MYFCESYLTMMLGLLLYSQLENPFMIHFLWGVGFLLMIVLIVSLILQRRTGLKLKDELAELDRLKEGNVEYEFVVKAMKLATWNINPKLRTITMDNDYREGQDNYMPSPESHVALLCEMIDKSDAQRVMTALDDICTGRSNFYHQQYRVRSGNSGLMFWEESFAIIADRDAEGNPTKVVGTTMRIDERKKLEADLINARNKAEESDRLKTAFLANMGHEIRTPLNAIVGFADLLPVIKGEEERNQLINEIQINNRKLLRIIDGLVSMSKIEAQAKNLVKSQTDLVPLLNEIAKEHATMVDQQSVVLVTQFPYTQLMITTDVSKLKEIVNNLMQNAVKFTLKGCITLGFDMQEGDHVRIWVKDTGKGIPEADLTKIFDRFVKLDEYIPGTGLGLSVVKSHVDSLGGTLGVESHIGQGSTFWVDLPLA
jgi:signal transduction histidine kinase